MSSKIYLIIADYLCWYLHTQALLISVRKHKLNQEPADETVKKLKNNNKNNRILL